MKTAEEIRESAIKRMSEIYPLANEDDYPDNPNVNKINHRCRGAFMSGVDFTLNQEAQFNKPPVYEIDVQKLRNTVSDAEFRKLLAGMLPPSPGSVDVDEKKEYCDGTFYCSLDSTYNSDGTCGGCGKKKRNGVDGLGDSSGSEKKELPAVIKFLLGEGTLNGKWYGQTVAGTPFWWRKELRKLFESVKEVSREGEIAELHEKLEEITFYEEEARRQIGIRDQLLEDIFYNRLKPEVIKQKIDDILNLPF